MRGAPFPRHTFFLTERLLGEKPVLGARAVILRGTWQTPRHWLLCCATNYLNAQALKQQTFLIAHSFCGLGPGSDLASSPAQGV